MEFFKKFFKVMHEYDNGEAAVKCPFPHKDEQGRQYYESNPSAHINFSKNVFHCKVCGSGMSEAAFLSKMQGISYKDALVLLKELDADRGGWTEERQNFLNSAGAQELWTSLSLDLRTADELKIGYLGEGVTFPVFVYGDLLDTRNYLPGRQPKVLSRKGAKNLILPFDLWRKDDRPTLLCAGEKDMAIARQNGFNAITFTGGEQAFPKLFKASFKGKQIYIVYDNDQAGQEGSRKIASLLKECGAIPHVVTGHYQVCTEKGEDIHDFFIKYARTAEDLQKVLDETPEFSEQEHRTEQEKRIPLVTIEEATKGEYENRLVSSRVSVTATYEEVYRVPEYVELRKTYVTNRCAMEEGETREWQLDESNARDILLLMDSGLKKTQADENLKMLARIPPKEKFISITTKSRMNVFKAVVTDDLESEVSDGTEEGTSIRELLVYSIGEPIKAGRKYRIYYKPVAHPLKGQQVVGIVTQLEDSDNSINRFTVTPQVLESLKCFQVKPNEKVKDKMTELYERSKGIIGVEAREEVMYATDLFFHTPLQFWFGKRLERAYLDVMMIGDPRTGKSQAAKKLLQMYELGLITSLKTATTAGLLGGSDQVGGSWKTKLGLIPRNHKGALIMEEFSGGGQELISKLTEVRSSNRVRLTRVNGSIDVPAMVRMLSISNPAVGASGYSMPLKNTASGVQTILDLVGAAEDIARYDFFLLVDEPDNYTSPLAEYDKEPYPKESYLNRIRWVWSRRPDQIIIDPATSRYTVDIGDRLNNEYNCHIKLFGPETWKKLIRIAIACAGMVCSMDTTGERLIVNREHVDWAKKFMESCYDNKLFKLKEYVTNQRRFEVVDDEGVHRLKGLYAQYPIMLNQLAISTEMNQRDLQMVSGLETKDFNKVISTLVSLAFVQMPNSKLLPTQRFRQSMNLIDKEQFMKKIGE